MRRKDEYVYDFATDAWVIPDGFNGGIDQPLARKASASEPLPGFWTKPAPVEKQTSSLTVLLIWLTILAASATFYRPFFFLPAIVLGVAAYLSDAARSNDPLQRNADRMLLENPDDPDVLLVGIAIVRDGITLGTDRGVVWFDDGKLLYNGHRTSFAIGGEDILLPDEWPRGIYTDHLEIPDRMVLLRTPGIRTSVEFTPVLFQKDSTSQEMRFLKRFYNFRRRPPQSRGSRQWPPFDPSP